MGSRPWIASSYLLGKKIGSHALPVFASGARFSVPRPTASSLLLLLFHVPKMFREWVGIGWIWRDFRGVISIEINDLGASCHLSEWLRRRSFYPLNYGEAGLGLYGAQSAPQLVAAGA